MTYGIPADMFFLFIIRMDDQMIESILSDADALHDKNRAGFLKFISDSFKQHKLLWGDTSLLALQGTYQNNTRNGYSFIGNSSHKRLDLIVEVNDNNEITHITSSPDFMFDHIGFTQEIIPKNLW